MTETPAQSTKTLTGKFDVISRVESRASAHQYVQGKGSCCARAPRTPPCIGNSGPRFNRPPFTQWPSPVVITFLGPISPLWGSLRLSVLAVARCMRSWVYTTPRSPPHLALRRTNVSAGACPFLRRRFRWSAEALMGGSRD